MKAAIHYFSGTGNTARAVQAIAARLEAAGGEVSIRSIDGRAEPPPEIPDLTLVAFPIWAWAAPHFVRAYARRLPKAQGARAAVFATCGGFGAQGVGEMTRILRRRGYRVAGSGEAAYPDNWLLAVNPPKGPELNEALAKGDQAAQLFANNVFLDKPKLFRCAVAHKIWSWPISMLFRTFGRRLLGKFFIADDRCISCGQCATSCPVQAIRMDGALARPRWNASCAGCYRCIHLCPVQAIQISVPRLVFHLGLNLVLMAGFFYLMGGIHRSLPPMAGLVSWSVATLAALAVFVMATMLQLTAVDRCLHWLATRPPLRRFFQLNYTKSFGRYRAPGFQPMGATKGEEGHSCKVK